jgi:Tol biopolymer transport system component
MNAATREAVKELLELAVDFGWDENSPELHEKLPQDSHAAAEVLRLLRARRRMGGFLEYREGPSEEELAPGIVVMGRYRIVERLAEGGFGVAYLGEDRSLQGRKVVVKVLKAGIAAQERLDREIAALLRVHHSGVVGVLDAGRTAGGQSALVLRYVEGPTLRQVLDASGPLPLERTRRILQDVAEALDACHRQEILHLDLRPENIVLEPLRDRGERAVILDFGVAAILSEMRETPYRAVVRGQEEWFPSKRTDTSALGRVAQECLTGKPHGVSPHALPTAWRRFLARAVSSQSGFADAGELLRAIPERTSQHLRLAWLALAGSLVLGLLVGFRPQPGLDVTVGEFQPLTSDPGEETSPAIAPDGQSYAYVAADATTRQANLHIRRFDEQRGRNLTHSAKRERSPAFSRDGRFLAFGREVGLGNYNVLVRDLQDGRERVIATGALLGLDWSPDGASVYASLGANRESPHRLVRIDVRQGTYAAVLADANDTIGQTYPAVSPDGKRIAYTAGRNHMRSRIYAMELGVESPQPVLLAEPRMMVRSPQWSADGKAIFYLAGTSAHLGLYSVSTDGKRHVRRYPEAGENLDHLAIGWSPSRMIVVRSQVDQNIWRLKVREGKADGAKPERVVESTWDDEEFALSPNGRWLAFNSHRTGAEEVWLSAVDGQNQRQLTNFRRCEDLRLLWRPDGKRILAHCWMDDRFRRYLVSPEGEVDDLGIPHLGEQDAVLAWSRDGRKLYLRTDLQFGQFQLTELQIHTGRRTTLARLRADVAEEGVDGTLYFAGRADGSPLYGLRSGSAEVKQILTGVTRRMVAIGANGVYYAHSLVEPEIRYQKFSTVGAGPQWNTQIVVARLLKPPGFGFSLSPSGDYLYWTQMDQDGADLLVAPVHLR